jgi:hypothetical protein
MSARDAYSSVRRRLTSQPIVALAATRSAGTPSPIKTATVQPNRGLNAWTDAATHEVTASAMHPNSECPKPPGGGGSLDIAVDGNGVLLARGVR